MHLRNIRKTRRFMLCRRYSKGLWISLSLPWNIWWRNHCKIYYIFSGCIRFPKLMFWCWQIWPGTLDYCNKGASRSLTIKILFLYTGYSFFVFFNLIFYISFQYWVLFLEKKNKKYVNLVLINLYFCWKTFNNSILNYFRFIFLYFEK